MPGVIIAIALVAAVEFAITEGAVPLGTSLKMSLPSLTYSGFNFAITSRSKPGPCLYSLVCFALSY